MSADVAVDSVPRYSDGTVYRIGDRADGGLILYVRPPRIDEHDESCPDGRDRSKKAECRCVKPWRAVISVDGGPGYVRRLSRLLPDPPLFDVDVELDAPTELAPVAELIERVGCGPLVRLRLPCSHERTVTETLWRLSDRVGSPITCPLCLDRSRSGTV